MKPLLPVVTGVLLIALAGCQPDDNGDAAEAPREAEKTRPDPPVVAMRSLALDDGATLVYETHGAGEVAVVMVHCWGCNRAFWRRQIQPLISAGYRVVTMDLPGHGVAGRKRENWKVASYANDLRQLADHLKLERIVLAGHSMGGPVSLIAAPLLKGRVEGIVCVDTLHDVEFEWPEDWTEELLARLDQDFGAGLNSFIPQLFKPGADPELVKWVRDQALRADPGALKALMADFPELDMPALLAGAGVPVRCINAAPEEEFGMSTALETNRRHADFDAVIMEGVGHYPQLEAPKRFNEHLLQVLEGLAD